jgi:hypothetical protein
VQVADMNRVKCAAVDCNLCHIKLIKTQQPGLAINRYLGEVQDRERL